MLELKNIVKTFKDKNTGQDRKVLNDINLSVKEGEVYGLIGANGAGKTTLMNIISRVLAQNSGHVFVDGKEMNSLNDIVGKVGYMLDIPAMFEFMTAHEYFEYLSSPMKKSKEEVEALTQKLLEEVGLLDVKGKLIKKYSRGMKQRLGIAAALIANPNIILMDEPSSALDPQGRYEVIKIMEGLRAQGKTIILSTHILNDVERVCDRMGLLSNGSLIIEGSLHDVLNKFSENAFVVTAETEILEKIKGKISGKEGIKEVKIEGTTLAVYFDKDDKTKAFKIIAGSSDKIDAINLKVSTIEEIFLKTNQIKPKNTWGQPVTDDTAGGSRGVAK